MKLRASLTVRSTCLVAHSMGSWLAVETLRHQTRVRSGRWQKAKGTRTLFGDSTIAACANLSTGCR
jgi:esterase/lipase superfamily enzyme